MNIKISKEQHESLLNKTYTQYTYGSRLYDTINENSDYDYLNVLIDDYNFKTLATYLPNINPLQYTENQNKQYLWMSERQFWSGLFSGNQHIVSDILLLDSNIQTKKECLNLCYSYKIIKSYLGLVKRDVKKHSNWEKRLFHSARGLYMAEMLMKKQLPTIKDIQVLFKIDFKSKTEELKEKEIFLRNKLNEMLSNKEIFHYPIIIEKDEIANILSFNNNTIEFKYEK